MQQQHKNQTAYSKQAEMDEAIDRVNNFINCLNIKKNRKEELKRIVDLIQISYHKALDDKFHMKRKNVEVQKKCNKVTQALKDLREESGKVSAELDVLKCKFEEFQNENKKIQNKNKTIQNENKTIQNENKIIQNKNQELEKNMTEEVQLKFAENNEIYKHQMKYVFDFELFYTDDILNEIKNKMLNQIQDNMLNQIQDISYNDTPSKYLNFQTYLNTPTKTTTDSDVNRPLRVLIIKRHKNIDTIIDGKIESGCCRVGDRCLIMPNRTCVEVTNIYYEDIETDSCDCGKNVRLKLNNIEEEISPGFILCNVQQDPCRVGRVFDAQIAIIEHQSIIYPGYSAVLHIHAAITTVQLKQIIRLIDHETGNTIQEHPTFIKQGQIVIARFELLQSGEAICMETFKDYPQLGRFTLCNARQTVALGNVLEIIE
ncbi:unnamed protein product [Rotaria sp. Silwood1]|nr:unnamed protein product [Rotaria sp. Silwood1]